MPIDPTLVRLLDDARHEAAEHADDEHALTYATVRRYRASATYPLFQRITDAVRQYTH